MRFRKQKCCPAKIMFIYIKYLAGVSCTSLHTFVGSTNKQRIYGTHDFHFCSQLRGILTFPGYDILLDATALKSKEKDVFETSKRQAGLRVIFIPNGMTHESSLGTVYFLQEHFSFMTLPAFTFHSCFKNTGISSTVCAILHFEA